MRKSDCFWCGLPLDTRPAIHVEGCSYPVRVAVGSGRAHRLCHMFVVRRGIHAFAMGGVARIVRWKDSPAGQDLRWHRIKMRGVSGVFRQRGGQFRGLLYDLNDGKIFAASRMYKTHRGAEAWCGRLGVVWRCSECLIPNPRERGDCIACGVTLQRPGDLVLTEGVAS